MAAARRLPSGDSARWWIGLATNRLTGWPPGWANSSCFSSPVWLSHFLMVLW